MMDKSFSIILVVSPMTPEDDYYIDVDPLDLGVERGDVARFVIQILGNYAGGINLEITDAPRGAKVEFDTPNPVLVSSVVIMSVDTSNVFPGKYEMFVRATPARDGKQPTGPHKVSSHDSAVVVSDPGGIVQRSANVASLAADVATQAASVANELSELHK